MSTVMRECENCKEPTHEQILCDGCGVEICEECVPEPDDGGMDWCGNCGEKRDAEANRLEGTQ